MDIVVHNWGNSLGIRIPNHIVKQLNLQHGTHIEIMEEDGKIILVPKKKQSLKNKLSLISKENLHSEFETGAAKGKEVW